jgi:ankyrin repeat protein
MTYTTLLAKAARKGYVEVVRVLLEQGADTEIPCIGGETPLTQAACWGFYEVVELLIQFGANVHYKTPNRWTAIRWCETNENQNQANYQRIAQLLLKHMYPNLKT